ncbi:MAG: site-2 protease family protein [Clostridia bacterium]|nr:site-2 protease family protein [Clostridia bacterium]
MNRRIKIDPLAAAALLYLLWIERSVWALLSLAAAAFHELGHLLMAAVLHIPIKRMTIGVFGAQVALENRLLSYREELLLAAAGPAMNLILLVFCIIWHRRAPNEHLLGFAAASFALALVNLLPIRCLDGGRILYCAAAQYFDEAVAETVLRVCSAVGSMLIWLAASSLWLVSAGNLSLLVISCLLLWRIVRDNFGGMCQNE